MKRRYFLRNGLALGCSAAASPLLAPLSFAAGPWEARLIVIILRGGMDGLDVIRPVGDPDFLGLRPNMANVGLDLTGFFALHPDLAPLLPLWQAGEFGAIHATSTPYRDKRSHFDGQDILEAGTPGLIGAGRDGWLNRMLQIVPGVTAQTAYAIGPEQMLVLTGEAPASRWSPEAALKLSPHARRLLELVMHDDPLFQQAAEQAIAITDGLQFTAEAEARMMDDLKADPTMAAIGKGQHIALAQFAAARLRGESRIASFSLNGWDTHRDQHRALTRVLSELSDTLLTLKAGLGPVWGKTAVLCMTEFGRTARENGTKGTDHGTGGAMLYAGGALKGGQVPGDWPGLAEADLYAGRDLAPLTDVRGHAAWVMRGLLGLNRDALEGTVFPGLDMARDPGILL